MTGASPSDVRLSVTDHLGHRVARIDASPFTIGRSVESKLRVIGSEVSREHAEIITDGNRYVLRDCGSRYGTFVNGEPKREHVLVEGDRIRLGRSAAVELLFLTRPGETADAQSMVGVVRHTAALLEGLRALGTAHVLQDVLILVLDAAIEVSGADRGFIMLAMASGELEFTIARARGRVTLSGQTFKTSQRIPKEVFATGEPRVVKDLIEGEDADIHSATIALGIRQVLCVPLRLLRYVDQVDAAPEPRRIGVLYLDGRGTTRLLSLDTQVGVESLATEAAVAIDNARLYREAVEKGRLDNELRIAAAMQQALRPARSHRGAGFEIASASQSSRSIGGDFFDYLDFPDDAFGLALGDVAGKGPSAAVLAAALQGMFAAYASNDAPPGQILSRMNVMLARHFMADRFATMIYAVLRRGGLLTYSIAGHNPPMLFSSTMVRRLEKGGMPLGLFAHAEFPEGAVQLVAGDVLVFFSDGVSEAPNSAGDPFGDERIASAIRARLNADVDELLEELLTNVKDFSGRTVPQDDVTAIVLRYLG
jgi:serine phosphatase RsbU (regulator of sigma subunit)